MNSKFGENEGLQGLDQSYHENSQLISKAINCESQGKWHEASQLRLAILKFYETTLGDKILGTLALHHLAYTYQRQGLLEEVSISQTNALQTQREWLGDDHVTTLWSMHALACTHAHQEILTQAERLEEYVVSARERILGESNPETLWAMAVLATIYLGQGRTHDAQSLDRRIVHLARVYRGNDRPSETVDDFLPQVCEATWRTRGTFGHESTIIVEWMRKVRKSSQIQVRYRTDASNSTTLRGNSDSINENSYSAENRSSLSNNSMDLFETYSSNADELRIGTHTPVQDVFRLLVTSRCLDLTDKLNLSKCPIPPYAGGRFGDVWCGELDDGSTIAIKCLRLHTTSETSMKIVKRAARELYYWSKAKHKNVLELIGIAMFRKRLAMISPWMLNGTLFSYILKNPNVNHWELCQQVAEGLAYIHEIGMIHGDLNAINILISDEGIAKLSDFGNAILSDHSLAFTATTNVGGGTSRWMAPELLFGKDSDGNDVDRSKPADVYALGMIVSEDDSASLQEVVTGQHPYSERRADASVTFAIIEGHLPDRPPQFHSETRHGDERWQLLLDCWSSIRRKNLLKWLKFEAI
ncbi:Tyrosine kinase domain protein [Ceratobasidium sp. AG-Ba]|nr:Tyrosine kinase domain protein [Ceratobasidium sp. AG-Ba]